MLSGDALNTKRGDITAEIKWIKIATGVFDNKKIKQIEDLPDADTIIVIWFKLLCLAGTCNADGMVYFTPDIPYTDQMLARHFNRPLSTVQLALNIFQQYGMIEVVDNFLYISSWAKYQNIDGMDLIREQSRKRTEEYRARKRLGVTSVGEKCVYCGKPANAVDHIIPKSKGGQDVEWNLVPCCKSCNSSKKDKDLAEFLNDSFNYSYQNIDHELVRKNKKLMNLAKWDVSRHRYITVTECDGADIDIESEIESEKEVLTPSKEGVCRTKDVRRIIEAWNSLGLQQIQKITADSSRGKMLKARVAEYGVDEVLRAIEKVRSSDFLRGSKDFLITFEWFVKPNNFPKVLEGNYDNRGGKKESGTSNPFLRGLMKGIDDEEE